ncbi:MAG: hypothetical protein ACTSRU_16080, partial [Candidatus Hodarchaeales archaeon]
HGIPSMDIYEDTLSPYYHSSEDTDNQSEYNYNYGAELSAAIASAVLYYCDRLTQPLSIMDFEGSLKPDQTKKFIIPALKNEFISSKLVSVTGSDGVFFRLVNTTGWTATMDFTKMSEGRNELEVINNGTVPVNFSIRNIISGDENHNGLADCIELDSDGDSLSDYNEVFIYDTNPFAADTDHDGLEDKIEIVMQMNPRNNDTDSDLMFDYYEFINSLNPLVNDSFSDKDGDGLTNYHESLLGTFAILADSDKDGFNDYVEVQAGTDPLNGKSFPETQSTSSTTTQPATSEEITSSTSQSTEIEESPAFDWLIMIAGFLIPVSLRKKRRG